jgi:hypothetical protein
MVVTPSGIAMLVKPEQPKNAELPMLARWLLSEMTTLSKEEQSENALSPMLVTPTGIVMLVRAAQSENA